MILGTILHKIYECVTTKEEITREVIDTALDNYIETNFDKIIDVNLIKDLYPLMSAVTVNEYVIPSNSKYKVATELSMSNKLADGIYLAGTCDRVEDLNSNVCIVDYKNVSTKPSGNTIPFHYKIQLLSYAKLYKDNYNITPNEIKLVYTVRPTKTLPARCIVVSEVITNND